jgi:predicted TIM-barrel enzyme
MRGIIVADLACPPVPAADVIMLAPYLAGLSADAADVVGMMPIGSANEALLAAAGIESPRTLIAALFLCDPFLRGRWLFERLCGRGVSGIVNWPTTNLVSPGVYRQALGAAGLDAGAELTALVEAREMGLEAMAAIATYEQAARAVEAGITALLLHPGTPTGESGFDQRLLEGVMASIVRIRAMPQRPRLALYRHPGFGGLIAPAAELVDDVFDWAVTQRPVQLDSVQTV